MAKKAKKISISKMDEVANERFPNVTTEEWHGIEVTITPTISLQDTLEFVNNVVTSCFQKESGYMPELEGFSFRCEVLTRYANFSLPENLEHKHRLVFDTDAYDFVLGFVNVDQLSEIRDAIEDKIAYLCNTNVNAVQHQLDQLVKAFEELSKSTSAALDGVSADDIKKLADAASGQKVDEEKLMQAWLKAKKEAGKDGGQQSAGDTERDRPVVELVKR